MHKPTLKELAGQFGLLRCNRCGACSAACPMRKVYPDFDSRYAPRITIARLLLSDALNGTKKLHDFLDEAGINYLDTLLDHVADYGRHNLTPEEYARPFYIGHYTPQGNFFFAHSIRDRVIDWLDPKPPTCRAEGISLAELAADLARDAEDN